MPGDGGAFLRTDTGVNANEFPCGKGIILTSGATFLNGCQFRNQAIAAGRAVIGWADLKGESRRLVGRRGARIRQVFHQTAADILSLVDEDPAFRVRDAVDAGGSGRLPLNVDGGEGTREAAFKGHNDSSLERRSDDGYAAAYPAG